MMIKDGLPGIRDGDCGQIFSLIEDIVCELCFQYHKLVLLL